MMSWMHGKHYVKFGAGIPHMNRRAFDDNTNALGTFTYGPTLASDGVTVLQSALQNYAANLPSGYSINYGETHFIYHQQEMGAFLQDQFKVNARFSITPGLRYDWQNFLATRRLGFSPRVSFGWVLDPALQARPSRRRRRLLRPLRLRPAARPRSATPAATPPPLRHPLVRSRNPARRRLHTHLKLRKRPRIPGRPRRARAQRHASLTNCSTGSPSNANSARKPPPPSASTPCAKSAPSAPSTSTPPRRSPVTPCAPIPPYGRYRQMQPAGFLEGSGLDVSYRGRLNKYFTGLGRYTWSHYESNTGGIGLFPQNQYAPNDEWANASFDRRQRLGMYAMFHPESVLNLSAGIFANPAQP